MTYQFSDDGITKNDALNLVKYLQETKTIFCFNLLIRLSECLIDDEIVHILVNSFEKNKSLTYIDLSHNRIGDIGAKRIGEWLLSKPKGNTLLTLKLNDNVISVQGAIHFSEMIKVSEQLSELHLGLNRLQSEGGVHLLTAIALNKSLVKVDLSTNVCKNIILLLKKYFFAIIVLLLKILRVMACVFGGCTLIEMNGPIVEPLLCVLRGNSHLNELDLSGNVLIDKEAKSTSGYIMSQIKQGLNDKANSLILLDLRFCGFDQTDLSDVKKLLLAKQAKHKQTLRKQLHQIFISNN
ncbi:hypothetical protein RFI_25315 [Reticulomyxa filosa]|uniref:Uncharacterized protein n=1 Tax=Reticulomyxa filosa TaxID=46433 RepID=X6MF70_RETFI|nr:hypothetical protein RFI_25315 [Reticulomyxa filosa]|eukprot:ETO12062.1 hypothetical protein RFI_25315 [Reticulomyxa filosa]